MADRIQARAIRRCGELLKQIEPKQGANQNIRDGADMKVLTRTQVAQEAGLSERRANYRSGTQRHELRNSVEQTKCATTLRNRCEQVDCANRAPSLRGSWSKKTTTTTTGWELWTQLTATTKTALFFRNFGKSNLEVVDTTHSNNQNRDATPGQKAMAFAMQFPNTQQGKRNDLLNDLTSSPKGTAKVYLSQARFVLRNNPPAPKSQFPQYALDVMAGRMTLTEAYDATPGQKAMATAMAFPEDFKRSRKKSGSIVDSNNNFDRSTLSRARFVLRNNPSAADSIFPQYALDVMAGRMTLTEAYDATGGGTWVETDCRSVFLKF